MKIESVGLAAENLIRLKVNSIGDSLPMRQVAVKQGVNADIRSHDNSHRLPGCISQLKTKQDAVDNIRDATHGFIAVR